MKPDPNEVVFLTPKQLAARWNFANETIRRGLRMRTWPSHLINRRRLVAMKDVLAAEAAGRVESKN